MKGLARVYNAGHINRTTSQVPSTCLHFLAVADQKPHSRDSLGFPEDSTSAMATGNTTAPQRQLSQKEADIQMMLAAEVHLGTKNCNFQMERYVFKRRNDGIFLFQILHFSCDLN